MSDEKTRLWVLTDLVERVQKKYNEKIKEELYGIELTEPQSVEIALRQNLEPDKDLEVKKCGNKLKIIG